MELPISWSKLDSYIINRNELSQCAKCSAVCITNDMHQPFDFPCNCCQLLLCSFSVVKTLIRYLFSFKWQFGCLLYSLINVRQLYIFSIKPKLDMGLFVDFCVFAWIWLNLPDQNLELLCFDVQKNFMFPSGKFSQVKSTKNCMSSFGLIEKIWCCLIFI